MLLIALFPFANKLLLPGSDASTLFSTLFSTFVFVLAFLDKTIHLFPVFLVAIALSVLLYHFENANLVY